ncbi:hypothetical protein F4809DRAFT_645002 [Biscogniauxia mediterranea]|nr:hypothetical protein F4809DRAFT_645002 [Biscogniauxia mediterranea]
MARTINYRRPHIENGPAQERPSIRLAIILCPFYTLHSFSRDHGSCHGIRIHIRGSTTNAIPLPHRKNSERPFLRVPIPCLVILSLSTYCSVLSDTMVQRVRKYPERSAAVYDYFTICVKKLIISLTHRQELHKQIGQKKGEFLVITGTFKREDRRTMMPHHQHTQPTPDHPSPAARVDFFQSSV